MDYNIHDYDNLIYENFAYDTADTTVDFVQNEIHSLDGQYNIPYSPCETYECEYANVIPPHTGEDVGSVYASTSFNQTRATYGPDACGASNTQYGVDRKRTHCDRRSPVPSPA